MQLRSKSWIFVNVFQTSLKNEEPFGFEIEQGNVGFDVVPVLGREWRKEAELTVKLAKWGGDRDGVQFYKICMLFWEQWDKSETWCGKCWVLAVN